MLAHGFAPALPHLGFSTKPIVGFSIHLRICGLGFGLQSEAVYLSRMLLLHSFAFGNDKQKVPNKALDANAYACRGLIGSVIFHRWIERGVGQLRR